MSLVTILLTLAIAGFIFWIILQIPMPEVFRTIILSVMFLFLIIWVLQLLGIPTGLPRLILR